MQKIVSPLTSSDGLLEKLCANDSQHLHIACRSQREALFKTARPRLLRLAQLRGVQPDAVEDVVQETLLQAWKHLDRLSAPEGIHLWLDEICRNICRRYARKHAVEQRYFPPELASSRINNEERGEKDASLLNTLPDMHTLDPVEALCQQDMTALLNQALGLLPGNARQLVELCYLGEIPQREVAARQGLSLSALEARLHRARRQLRDIFSGPLRVEAEACGLILDQQLVEGWQETRLWCTLCGRRQLYGMFLVQPDGSVNLHMQCIDCQRLYGLSDIHNSNVHSRGLVSLAGLQTFRPAWKRTMQARTRQLLQMLSSDEQLCQSCGTPVFIQLIDKVQMERSVDGIVLPPGLYRHPYQFWVCWKCPRCSARPCTGTELFAASDLVYWSHIQARQFMMEHPRWISEPEILVEHEGQPALRLQMADLTSAARLTVLAHRRTLQVLALFS